MLKQGLQQRLLQKLSPQQIQLMKLLQVPTASLEQRIKEELEVNPALEEGLEEDTEDQADEFQDEEDYEEPGDDAAQETDSRDDDFDIADYITDDDVPYYKTSSNNHSSDDERTEIPIASGSSFQDQLIAQLVITDLDDRQRRIGRQLLGSLDDDGYLRRDVESIVDDLAFSQNITTTTDEINEVLKTVQTFDPAGVGARNLRECLLLQLERKDQDDKLVRQATRIVSDYIDEFSKKHYEKIAGSLNLDDEMLKAAIHEILKLNPRPGSTFLTDARSSEAIIPDFIISNDEGNLELTLNSRNAPELRVSRTYSEMLEDYSHDKTSRRANRDALQFVKQKLDSARWFIDAIKQRQATLLKTMSAILNYQIEYFKEGDEKLLRPMILKDIADIVGMDISTVSRVANSKYVQTPFGTFLLKTFFSESMTTESGEEVSSREVKKILSDAVSSEDKHHPLPDDQLARLLKDKGYNIARRTIAKYRDQLNIPVARLRKEV